MTSARKENKANSHIVIRYLPFASFIRNEGERPFCTIDSIPRQRNPWHCINRSMRVSQVDLCKRPRGMLNKKCMGIAEHGIYKEP